MLHCCTAALHFDPLALSLYRRTSVVFLSAGFSHPSGPLVLTNSEGRREEAGWGAVSGRIRLGVLGSPLLRREVITP